MATNEQAVTDPPFIGRPLPRMEDERLLRGEGCFVDDVKYADMAHAVVVRSTVAHGILRSVDTAQALAMDGVLAVITARDVGSPMPHIPVRVGVLAGLERCEQPVIAADRVRYVGEPVAVVIAADRYVAEDAADVVHADIEPLDPVVDALAATSRQPLHPAVPDNRPVHYSTRRGEPDQAFRQAEYTRRERFYVHRHSSVPMETRGLVAHWRDDGHLDVWGAAKVPFFNRKLLAGMLGMAEDRVDLHEVDTGGSFGTRGEFYPEDYLIPFSARLVGRAVKWVEDRRESLLAMNHSRDVHCELELAATREGRILGLRASLVSDTGAYSRTTGGIVAAKCAMFLPGPYDIAHYACEVAIVLTNKTPCGTYRGPGRYEANFFRERMIDLMCADLALDPAAVRLANLVRPSQMPYDIGSLVPYEGALRYDSGNYPAALQRAMEEIGYDRLAGRQGQLVDGKYHGVGIGCFVDSSGAGPSETARIRIAAPDRIELYTGCSSTGQGQETSFAQVLADALGVPAHAIRVFHGSTTCVPHGFGTYHGRGMVMGGSAVRVTADLLARAWKAEAARRHDLPAETLRLHGGRIVDDGGSVLLTLQDVCDSGDAALLEATGKFEQKTVTFEYGTQIAHVAVDAETAVVQVLSLVTVEDCGRVINPLIVHGQVVGASVQGLGGTLLEEFRYDESGQMLSGTFADYLLPTATDFPSVDAVSIDLAPSCLNPLGAKGVGEGGTEGVGAAVANAVCHALRSHGANILRLPITPDSVFQAMASASHGP